MAGPVNSILLVDCDSLRRSLAAVAGAGAAARLQERLDEWLGAIETGELAPVDSRVFDAKRCYVGPTESADDDTFAAAGFFVVHHGTGGPADMRLVVDAMDAMMTADTGTEFILLTAASDLAPLAERLKAGNHRVTIYADDDPAPDYRATVDAVITAEDLAAILADEDDAPVEPPAAEPVDRAKIEAFAREIHAATNIPLFSPRIFSELFRTLAKEVASRGYHFQDTAKNVAEALSRAGRTITSRQVVFVVKGLALKGHVFSNDDTPERLADVFREQARYLIGNAGIAMTPERERILAAWIAAPTPARRPSTTTARPDIPVRPAAPKSIRKPTSLKTARPAAPEPEAEAEEKADSMEPPAAELAAPPEPAPPTARPETTLQPIVRPKSTTLPARPTTPPKPQIKQPTAAELRAAIAARIQAAARLRQQQPRPEPAASEEKPVQPRPSSLRPSRPTRTPPPPPPPPEPEPVEDVDIDDPIESSILAAIAEAVDVLVEDHDVPPHDAEPAEDYREHEERRPAPERERRPEPEPDLSPEESDDLGDEIQRIVASYSRNRNEG